MVKDLITDTMKKNLIIVSVIKSGKDPAALFRKPSGDIP